MVSPLTHTEGLPSSVTSVVQEKDVDDDNGDEPLRTRRRHSPDTWHYHSGLPGVTCEAVRRRRGRACVAPRPRWVSDGAGLTRSGHSVSVCLSFSKKERRVSSQLVCVRFNVETGSTPA